MTGIPRYRRHDGPALLSAGFRPFFFGAALWAAIAMPLWLAAYSEGDALPSALPAPIWHAHEMVFGYGAAVVAGFLLTAIPNWTGRMPLQGGPLLALFLSWIAGRAAVLLSQKIGAAPAAALDLAFPLAFLGVVAREILAGRNWRNLPMLAALSALLAGNILVHLAALGVADTGEFGNRLGIATLLMLISLVGGRIIPSFTRNWLARQQPEEPAPAPFDAFDRGVLAATLLALALWAAAPDGRLAAAAALLAGAMLLARLARWRGAQAFGEPLLLILHIGYFWLGLGLVLLGLDRFLPFLPQTAALHALTVGAIGTMTLAVMSRASLGHTGRPLQAGRLTLAVYALVTLAALLRVLAPFAGSAYMPAIALAGTAWSGAFGLFAVSYAPVWTMPRVAGDARPI